MELPWMIGFGIVCGWAVLRVLGAERERRVRDLRLRIAAQPTDSAHSAKPADTSAAAKPPVRSKVAR